MTFGEWWDSKGVAEVRGFVSDNDLNLDVWDDRTKGLVQDIWEAAEEAALEDAAEKANVLLKEQEAGIHRVLKTLALAFWTIHPRAKKACSWLDERIDSLTHDQGLGLSSHEQAAVKEAAEQDDWKEEPAFDYDTPDIPF